MSGNLKFQKNSITTTSDNENILTYLRTQISLLNSDSTIPFSFKSVIFQCASDIQVTVNGVASNLLYNNVDSLYEFKQENVSINSFIVPTSGTTYSISFDF